jgi:hypothetical protein
MTPDNIILIMMLINAMALFVAYHFAMQADYYKKGYAKLKAKQPKRGPNGKFVSKAA